MGIDFSREFVPPAAGTYDMVMLNDVLEHIHDSPCELLNSLVNGLKTDGLLFITGISPVRQQTCDQFVGTIGTEAGRVGTQTGVE